MDVVLSKDCYDRMFESPCVMLLCRSFYLFHLRHLEMENDLLGLQSFRLLFHRQEPVFNKGMAVGVTNL